jgi:hypothetical protein
MVQTRLYRNAETIDVLFVTGVGRSFATRLQAATVIANIGAAIQQDTDPQSACNRLDNVKHLPCGRLSQA